MLDFTGTVRISRVGWAPELPDEERVKLEPILVQRVRGFFPEAHVTVEDFRGRFDIVGEPPEMVETVRVAVETIAMMLLAERAVSRASGQETLDEFVARNERKTRPQLDTR